MSSTNGTRAVVLTALMVVSVAAVGFAATGALAQSSGNEIDLSLSSTQPNSATGVTGLGAINGSNVLDAQVPGDKETGQVKKLRITSEGGLDFSGLRLIPAPTSGIDRNGDESGTAIDKDLVPLLQNLETINNGGGLLITLSEPVNVSVGDEIVISIGESNGVVTGPEGQYTLSTTAITPDGTETTPATAEYTIGNPAPTTKNVTIKGSGDYAAYSFGADNVNITEEDAEETVNNGTAYGAVGPDSDSYEITGSLDSLSVAGNATVMVDGQEVDPSNYSSDVQVVTFEGTGSVGSYSFNASGDVNGGIYLDSEDSFSGSSGSGAVNAGLETYFADGDLTNVSADDNVNVVQS